MRAVIEEAVASVLTGKVWRGEEETVWTVAISERIKAKVKGAYKYSCRAVYSSLPLALLLTDAAPCTSAATHCRAPNSSAAAELDYPRYKVVVQVVMGENKLQGVRVASRCLWDADTDGFATHSYKNDSLWCTAMVFAVYTE